jgi:hypothetical protein
VFENILLRRKYENKEGRENGGHTNIRSEVFHKFYSSADVVVGMDNGNDVLITWNSLGSQKHKQNKTSYRNFRIVLADIYLIPLE